MSLLMSIFILFVTNLDAAGLMFSELGHAPA